MNLRRTGKSRRSVRVQTCSCPEDTGLLGHPTPGEPDATAHGAEANRSAPRRRWRELGDGFAVSGNDNLLDGFERADQTCEIVPGLGDADVHDSSLDVLKRPSNNPQPPCQPNRPDKSLTSRQPCTCVAPASIAARGCPNGTHKPPQDHSGNRCAYLRMASRQSSKSIRPVARNHLIGRYQRQVLDSGLGYQCAVERVLMNGR